MRAAHSAPIPTASMADVAFLLLLFFLVATAIRDETGLQVVLPTADVQSDPAVLAVLVDAAGAVRLDGERVTPEEARARVAAAAARRPLVTVQAHRRTPYDAYVDALDAVLLGHRDAGAEPRLALREPAAGR